jgi:hypothetical protein
MDFISEKTGLNSGRKEASNMKSHRLIIAVTALLLTPGLWAQEDITSPTPVSSSKKTAVSERDLEIQMMKLEMEKCQLQNEKLQLEIERLRLQKGFGPSANPTQPPAASKKEEGKINFEASTRAEQMAKEHSDDPKMIIFDTQNGELWIEGVRYPVFELYHVMLDKKWELKRTLVTTKGDGTRRFRYKYKNISLEKYENKKYGVFVATKGNNEGDFQILTIEGVGFDISDGEVRNRFQNEYFRYDGENRDKKIFYLKYKHTHGFLGWDDKLVYGFDAQTKNLAEIKYGVLDEN